MRVIRDIKTLRRILDTARKKGLKIGFVPTMGYFHDGHLSLMRKAKKSNDVCLVSIYVNPKQFGPKEDLGRYPRDLRRDASLAKKENVDILFLPPDNAIYPDGYLTTVYVEGLSSVLCGAYRPGHFQGVATIVAKLLNIVGPCAMYLGAKDAQQVVILKRMVKDLNFPISVFVGKTVREKDGLALSSRNVFLDSQQRRQAVALHLALTEVRHLVSKGERRAAKLLQMIHAVIKQYPLVTLQYAACVNANDLTPLKVLRGDVLVLLAAFVGKTRLIDHCSITIHDA